MSTRPNPKDVLAAYQLISPDSGFPTIIHPNFNPVIASHIPPDPPHVEFTPPKDRAFFADPERKSLFSIPGAKAVDLTESIGMYCIIRII
jgi:sulfonate dioxygenase